jgi:pilus assembly protein HofM
MAFRNWRIGMHIQQDSIAIVALLFERSHWALRRWWRIPLPPGLVRQGMVADVSALGSRLAAWRRELPVQHQVSIAFPQLARCKSACLIPSSPCGSGNRRRG